MPVRHGEASWKGTVKEGQGWVKTETGALDATYSFGSRFEDKKGTNPEELIAAAHAGCFTMALDLMLGESGFKPEAIDTRASVSIEKKGDGFAITGIKLKTEAKIPGISKDQFLEHATKAKTGCPVSAALSAVPIELEAELLS